MVFFLSFFLSITKKEKKEKERIAKPDDPTKMFAEIRQFINYFSFQKINEMVEKSELTSNSVLLLSKVFAFFIAVVIVGIWTQLPTSVAYIGAIIQLYVAFFLLVRFNPLLKNKITITDCRLAYLSGWILLNSVALPWLLKLLSLWRTTVAVAKL